jgi:hypothetical protein
MRDRSSFLRLLLLGRRELELAVKRRQFLVFKISAFISPAYICRQREVRRRLFDHREFVRTAVIVGLRTSAREELRILTRCMSGRGISANLGHLAALYTPVSPTVYLKAMK